jgi:hypothetical protein
MAATSYLAVQSSRKRDPGTFSPRGLHHGIGSPDRRRLDREIDISGAKGSIPARAVCRARRRNTRRDTTSARTGNPFAMTRAAAVADAPRNPRREPSIMISVPFRFCGRTDIALAGFSGRRFSCAKPHYRSAAQGARSRRRFCPSCAGLARPAQRRSDAWVTSVLAITVMDFRVRSRGKQCNLPLEPGHEQDERMRFLATLGEVGWGRQRVRRGRRPCRTLKS